MFCYFHKLQLPFTLFFIIQFLMRIFIKIEIFYHKACFGVSLFCTFIRNRFPLVSHTSCANLTLIFLSAIDMRVPPTADASEIKAKIKKWCEKAGPGVDYEMILVRCFSQCKEMQRIELRQTGIRNFSSTEKKKV